MLWRYVQSFKSVVKLKVISFKDNFSKAQSLDTTGFFLLFQLQTPMCSFIPLDLFHLAFWFLLLNPVSHVSVTHWLSFSSFPNPYSLFQFLCYHFSFPNIYLWSSCFLSLFSLLITTCSGLPGNLLNSLFSLHISPIRIPSLLLNTTSSYI